jgi:hypothetical protein
MPPHRLRHLLFTWLKTQGIDDALIRPSSGHASRQSLEIYSDSPSPTPKRLRSSDRPLSGLKIIPVCGWRHAQEFRAVLEGGGRPTPLGRAVASSAGSPSPSTCSPTSTTRPTVGGSSPSSTGPRAGTRSPGPSSTDSVASCASATAKDRKTSSAPSAWSSTPSCVSRRWRGSPFPSLRLDERQGAGLGRRPPAAPRSWLPPGQLTQQPVRDLTWPTCSP